MSWFDRIWFWLLARLYPPRFRDRYGREMERAYERLLTLERERRPRTGRARVRLGALLDAVVNGARIRRRGPGATLGTEGSGKVTMWIGRWIRDVRYAARALVRQPLFVIASAGTLALGIGAATAVFSLVHGVLLTPLPVEEPERLVRVYLEEPEQPGGREYLTAMDALLVREQEDVLAEVAVFYDYEEVGADLTGGAAPERVRTLPVSSGYFRLLGVEPRLGRELAPTEEREGALVAIVSHGVWLQHLEASPMAVGRTLRLDGRPHTVIGVLPADFRDPVSGEVDVYVPQDLDPANDWNNWDNHYVSALARLAPRVTLEAAGERLRVAALAVNEMVRDDPDDYWLPRLVPLHDDLVGQANTLLWVLLGAVGLLLLLACVNVANLSIAFGVARAREMAVRSALGAGRAELARQRLCESGMVVLLGGVLGVALAGGAVAAFRRVVGQELPRADAIVLDAPVLLTATGITLVCALAFGLLPLVGRTRTAGSDGMLQERANAPASYRLRRALVTGQTALAVILLVGAAVLTRSFVALQRIDLGIDPAGVLTYQVHLPEARYPDAATRTAFYRELSERVRSLPGVVATGAVHWLPVQGRGYRWGLFRENPPESVEPVGADVRIVDGDYFEALDVAVVRGRALGPEDDGEAPPATVLNREAVRRVYPGDDPVGSQVRVGGRVWTVVGIVENVANDALGDVSPKVYLAHAQFADRRWAMHQVVETDADPALLVAGVRSALAEIDPELVLHQPRPLVEVLAEGVARQRLAVTVMSGFAALALVLAMIGIYGVLAFLVGRRSHEIGIRMALGARRRQVRAMVLRESFAVSLVGVVLGLVGAFGLSQWLQTLVYDGNVRDPAVYALVATVLLTVALLAAWLPARRASAVDPARAFRDG